ncbi:M20 family metallopeptidase [Actinoplanes sp. NPDC051343]|uniref:M20 family metallopeptidase n=1 Tax=Actinoplanes sp. NPDC051343 TaxID=3363906 RepID=UPI00379A6272
MPAQHSPFTDIPTVLGTALGTEFNQWLTANRDSLLADIMSLVSIDTASPNESAAFDWLTAYFEDLGGTVTALPRHPRLFDRPEANRNKYSDLPATARGSLRVDFTDSQPSAGRHVLFSGHVDVVPGGHDFPLAFQPEVRDGQVIGRGTADTKGNIVMLAAALRFLRDTGRRLGHRVSIDLIGEEEIGGNGALSSILYGSTATEVVVLEPTELEVFHGHRGCAGFTVDFIGKSSHMGGDGVSAITGAIDFVEQLRELESRLRSEARTAPGFEAVDRPLQINVGVINGGEWPGSLPQRCTLDGFFGFLPGYSVDDVRGMLDDLVAGLADPWLRTHTSIRLEGIRNGAYLGDPRCPIAVDLRRAVRAAGAEVAEGRAWNVSCDARLYHELLQVPTVVFGTGSLASAHSCTERLDIAEWSLGAYAFAALLNHGEEN